MALTRFKLVFFSPRHKTQEILKHLFIKLPTTVGKIGNYDHCAFVAQGIGQFRPSTSANPTLGTVEAHEHVEEDRVEVCINDNGEYAELHEAIVELKKIHPYEEVEYDIYRLESV